MAAPAMNAPIAVAGRATVTGQREGKEEHAAGRQRAEHLPHRQKADGVDRTGRHGEDGHDGHPPGIGREGWRRVGHSASVSDSML
ncbi:hypothetical protein GCM10010304_64670 [Streptomyces roseoviolaceus]